MSHEALLAINQIPEIGCLNGQSVNIIKRYDRLTDTWSIFAVYAFDPLTGALVNIASPWPGLRAGPCDAPQVTTLARRVTGVSSITGAQLIQAPFTKLVAISVKPVTGSATITGTVASTIPGTQPILVPGDVVQYSAQESGDLSGISVGLATVSDSADIFWTLK